LVSPYLWEAEDPIAELERAVACHEAEEQRLQDSLSA
jgi:hypothetical protein